MPAAKQAALSSAKALAVSATMTVEVPPRQQTNLPCRFQAANAGYLHVHEDQLIGVFTGQFDGYAAVLGHVHVVDHQPKHGQCHLPVHGIVVHQQQAGTRVLDRQGSLC